MNAEELADYVVEHFNAIEDPVIAFEATKPEDIAEAYKERDNYQVFVIPFSETETRIDRGDTCEQHRTVEVVVTGPIGQVTRFTALQFLTQLKRSLRLTKFDNHRWMGNETPTLWDPDAMKTKGQFLSVFHAEYVGLG